MLLLLAPGSEKGFAQDQDQDPRAMQGMSWLGEGLAGGSSARSNYYEN